ncbi:hypothetical protein AUJ84_00270 [Candidatus Pacearchaeota archaeon CG1_02_32_132]|nr:MAG: hypothetical protein AUJ84_00270 [Candidatus Pacearchaeota archaeon CG1_02_32_132]
MAKRKNKTERRIEGDLLKILLFFGFLILVFMISSAFFKSLSKFDYQGLEFSKDKYGELPVFKYYYIFNAPSGQLIKYTLVLKTDPRKNEVPIEGDKIEFMRGKPIFITSSEAELGSCRERIVALATLSAFLTDNQLKVQGAINDYNESVFYNQKYITCENRPNNLVIEFNSGDETKIEINGDCHKITVSPDCDIVKAVEKYELQSVLDAR